MAVAIGLPSRTWSVTPGPYSPVLSLQYCVYVPHVNFNKSPTSVANSNCVDS